ncbi:MAG TPA: HAMP domain-containing sensor histidine kinase, partial [Thermoanaerobaculia bacterium]|nr:HAMP domain-containing sensor histidine kinase [Thermoanaerobaculia bacterium]
KADLEFIVEFTRRVALAAENARLYAESQQAVRSREEILAIVSHDLRSPLTTITMTASMLAEMPPPEAELPQQFDVIHLSAKRMTRLIDDLLDVTTIDIGHRLPIEKSPVDLPELIDELAEIFRPQAAGRNVGLSWQVDVSPPTIPADRDRLNQALSNLVGNALKFTPEGGAVEVGVTDQGDEVQFSVRDDGLGIPAEHLQRIFDPYWQMKRTARMGAGLGLPIARGIVESHGGRIWVESDGTHGSTFRFTIPK